LFEWTDLGFRGIKLLAGRNPDTDWDGTPLTRQDLPRNEQGRALIGDPRNDENIIVSQLQLAFIKLHDRVVDRVKSSTGLTGGALLEEAQRRVRWHYQWMVVHDFLPRVCGPEIVASILKDEDAPPVRRSTCSSTAGRTSPSCRWSSRRRRSASATRWCGRPTT